MELRDEDRRMEKPPETYVKKPIVTTQIIYREQCERCGREAEIFYIWNGRKLCKSCLDEEQKKWGMVGGGPSAAPARVVYSRRGEGLLSSLIGGLLTRIGLKKAGKMNGEIVAAQPVKVEAKITKKDDKKNVVSFKYGKPMSEGLGEKEKAEEGKSAEEQRGPESEGIMKSEEAKPKKRKKAAKRKRKKKQA